MRTLTLTPATPLHFDTGRALTERELKNVAPYPKFGATVAKYRKLPRTPENIKAHAEALFAQLATFQRAEFRAKITEPDHCPCASGTWHSDGAKILKAIRTQHRSALDGALAESWRRRSDAQVAKAYLAAMEGRDAPLTYNIHV